MVKGGPTSKSFRFLRQISNKAIETENQPLPGACLPKLEPTKWFLEIGTISRSLAHWLIFQKKIHLISQGQRRSRSAQWQEIVRQCTPRGLPDFCSSNPWLSLISLLFWILHCAQDCIICNQICLQHWQWHTYGQKICQVIFVFLEINTIKLAIIKLLLKNNE